MHTLRMAVPNACQSCAIKHRCYTGWASSRRRIAYSITSSSERPFVATVSLWWAL